MTTRAEFQEAAVRHIVTRLRDKRGSRRFLLADEVGLGKTLVARGVIDTLSRGRRDPLTVIYLCSNLEIAVQNRSKLADGGGLNVRRVTELATRKRETGGSVALYSFTPGTSLSGGTGTAHERRLMLFLLGHLTTCPIGQKRWREFFRCGAGTDNWNRHATPRALRDEFLGEVHKSFQDEIRLELRDGSRLLERIIEAVEGFEVASPVERRRRNALVGELRAAMQRVALRSLAPDLLVLDEIQRFKDVIDKAEDNSLVSSELFRKGAPVLILSATPYKHLTLSHEVKGDTAPHNEDFFRTIRFLFGSDPRIPKEIEKELKDFRQQLEQVDPAGPVCQVLLRLKRSIEAKLRQVLSRTERNWYYLDGDHGVIEQKAGTRDYPDEAELREFLEVYRGLEPHLEGVGQVTEFWKSSPSLLTFMDRGYAFTRKLQQEKVRVPPGLLLPAGEPALATRNLKMRHLVEHALGPQGRTPYLWTRPTYTYYRDETYGDSPPRKMLVFSGWRFVPKAIAVILSTAASNRLPKAADEKAQPLRLGEKGSGQTLDVCFPSWALAELVDPRTGGGLADQAEVDVLLGVIGRLRDVLRDSGIGVVPKGRSNLWRVVARLEAGRPTRNEVKKALRGLSLSDEDSGESTDNLKGNFLEWMEGTSTSLAIAERDLKRLAMIALGSPAVCLLRGLLGCFARDEVEAQYGDVLKLGLGVIRRYYNRPLVQHVVRKHALGGKRRSPRGRGKASYHAQVLRYAFDHHLQAVFDEHTFLLRDATSHSTVSKAVAHYAQIWSLGRGSRQTNTGIGRGGDKRLGGKPQVSQTHFALAFGDEAAAEADASAGGDKPMRRSDIREAFNSPFWPFVLATTSVGQEGLDFHLHCRDVFHWNLPSNPVDLEQREGRINRRDSLAVRQSIARDCSSPSGDYPWKGARGNPWDAVFHALDQEHSAQRYKHGLYPHWIYECRDPQQTVRITRHVAYYKSSRDEGQYVRLKLGLSLYRLVFGQADQESLLVDLESRLEGKSQEERRAALQRLSSYMLNLSPIGQSEAKHFANEEAKALVGATPPTGLGRLLDDVRVVLAEHSEELEAVRQIVDDLMDRVARHLSGQPVSRHLLLKAVTALAYLRNPYDQFFDNQAAGGFDDDIAVFREAVRP